MPRICVLGGGVCGLATAMLLARDGHEVTTIERDAADVPATGDGAWRDWDRKGVGQFRQPHALRPRTRHILAAELPDVLDALRDGGAFRLDPLESLPPAITDRAPREGDDRFWTLTGRRPMVERVFAEAARSQRGLELIRGERAVRLVAGASASVGVPQVIGVETERRGVIRADFVVDAMGRQSRLPDWIVEMGGRRPYEEAEDCRFTYYTRYFVASADGSVPAPMASMLSEFPTYSLLTLPGDNQHWSVTVTTSNADEPMKRLRHTSVFMNLVAAHPLHSHWLDGEPVSDVLPIAGVMDRYRRFVVDGRPVVTGILAVADAFACTNPSAGRGISVGLMHAVELRDLLRREADSSLRLAQAWDDVTERNVAPWYRLQVKADRARVARIDAARDGRELPAPPGGQDQPEAALAAAAPYDADAFRANAEVVGCLALPEEILARPGLAARVLDSARDKEPKPLPGPDRAQLAAILA